MTNRDSCFKQINTEFEKSYITVAKITKELGYIDESITAAKRVFSYNPNSSLMLEIFPEFKKPILEIGELVEQYSKNLKSDKTNIESWTSLGFCYLILGDFPNSFAAFGISLRFDSTNQDPNFLYAIAVAYGHFKIFEDSFRCLQKIREISNNFDLMPDVLLRLSILYKIKENYSQSLAMLESITNNPPTLYTSDDILFIVAYMKQLSGDIAAAKGIYEDLINRFPDNITVLTQYSYFLFLYLFDSSHDENVKILEKLLVTSPRDPILNIILSRYIVHEDHAKALSLYNRCKSHSVDFPYYWLNLGNLNFILDEIDLARSHYQEALSSRKDLSEAWLNLGLICEIKKDSREAINIYRRGLENCQNNKEFNARIEKLTVKSKDKQTLPVLKEIDDLKYIVQIPEKFCSDYISAVPMLPPSCFKDGKYHSGAFHQLNTLPKSTFLNATRGT